MVAPVTGPFVKTVDFEYSFVTQQSWRQKRNPIDRPLPYIMDAAWITDRTDPLTTRASGMRAGPSSLSVNQAKINAYDRLKDKLGDRAQFGENLAQLDKSIATITARANQLTRFTRRVKRFDIPGAIRELRHPEPAKVRARLQSGKATKGLTGQWMEYHLGIEPAVNDIWTAIDILQMPIKNHVAKGRGRSRYDYVGPYPGPFSMYREVHLDVFYQYVAEVAIDNPNLYLANALGLVNPAQLAWQLAPLSFVLDWFVNVEQFLGTATDFLGLTLKNATSTLYYHGLNSEIWTSYNYRCEAECWGVTRGIGIDTPGLSLRAQKVLSWQRGLTAVSLLVNELKSI